MSVASYIYIYIYISMLLVYLWRRSVPMDVSMTKSDIPFFVHMNIQNIGQNPQSVIWSAGGWVALILGTGGIKLNTQI